MYSLVRTGRGTYLKGPLFLMYVICVSLCVCVFFFSFFLNDPNTVHVKFDVMCSINHALYAYSRVYLM